MIILSRYSLDLKKKGGAGGGHTPIFGQRTERTSRLLLPKFCQFYAIICTCPSGFPSQKSSSRWFPLPYFFILMQRASCYLRRHILQMPSRGVEISLSTTVPISLVHGLKLIHVPWRYPTHIAYQMEAECQVLKLSPKLIVSLSNSTHTLYHKLMKKVQHHYKNLNSAACAHTGV